MAATTTTTEDTITYTTTEVVTIGDSREYVKMLHDDVTTSNQLLGFLILLLIGGWLYSYFRDLVNHC